MTTLTPLELAIVKSLWRRGHARVRDVQADLLPARKLAYTTVMTVLDRLFRKGVVQRTRQSRAHVYEPAVSEVELRHDAVTRLLRDFFGGSEEALEDYLRSGEAPPPGDALPGPVLPEPTSRAEGHPIDESLL